MYRVVLIDDEALIGDVSAFPGLTNTANDKVHTLSVIDL